MAEFLIRYEWAIVFLGLIAFGLWELYALRRDKRRTQKQDKPDGSN